MEILNIKSTTKRFNILHDAYQGYEDIFTKYVSREFRDRTDKYPDLDDSMESWGTDADFAVARAGVRYARSSGMSDSTDHRLPQFLDELSEVAAKQVHDMNLPRLGSFRLSDSELRKQQNRYKAQVLSKPVIFGIGLEQTKRFSLRKALGMLGIDSAQYSESDDQLEKLSSGELDYSLLDFYDGAIDIGIVPHYKELDEKFKNAKFILTVRNKNRWQNAIERYWRSTAKQETVGNNDLSFRTRQRLLIREKVYGIKSYVREDVLRAYQDHYEDVIDHFSGRPEKLLVMDIAAGDGWEKLCKFLRIPIPNTEFPYKRETHESYV